jgi:uncharacterized membrane protein
MKNIILMLAGLYFLLALLAATLPGILGKNQEGFAAGTTAALTFFIAGGLAAVVSALILGLVLRNHKELDRISIVIGLLPAVITVFAAIGIYIIATIS